MPKVKLHDLVVVLPGITGSVLSKRGRDVWAVSGGALWSALTSLGDSVQELKLPRHDPCGDPPHTELTATGLINDFHGVFGLWRIDGYDATVQAIVAGFDVQAGAPDDPNEHANLIAFPYDWRLSNRVAARALQALVNRRLPAYRKAKSKCTEGRRRPVKPSTSTTSRSSLSTPSSTSRRGSSALSYSRRSTVT